MTKKQYNSSLLLEMMDGNQDEIKELAIMLFDLGPQMIDEIKICIDNGDWVKAGDISHKLKSSLMLWQMTDLIPLAVSIEKKGRSNIDHSDIRENFKLLDIELNKVLNRMKEEYL